MNLLHYTVYSQFKHKFSQMNGEVDDLPHVEEFVYPITLESSHADTVLFVSEVYDFSQIQWR